MKRTILLFGLIFLNSCSAGTVKQAVCSGNLWEKSYVLDFEYGSVSMNDKALADVRKIARNAAGSGAEVRIVGYESYRSVPENALHDAFYRALKTAEVFLDNGVRGEFIYIDVEPRSESAGLDAPLSAADEHFQAEIRIKGNGL